MRNGTKINLKGRNKNDKRLGSHKIYRKKKRMLKVRRSK